MAKKSVSKQTIAEIVKEEKKIEEPKKGKKA